MNTFIAFAIVFGVIVFFHELGHLYFAKRAGILCREFAIGFGPKIFSFMKNETVYTIRLLPLGGFVRMAGAEDEMFELKAGSQVGLLLDESNKVTKIVTSHFEKYQDLKVLEVENADLDHELTVEGYENNSDQLQTYSVNEKAMYVEGRDEFQIAPYHRQFNSKTVGQRAMAIFAGPLMNFVLAIVLMIAVGLVEGIPTDNPQMGELVADGEAVKAGLHTGDEVLAINHEPVQSWQEIVTTIQENPNQELVMEIQRDGEKMEIPVTPASFETDQGEVGRIGVLPPTERNVVGAVTSGVTGTVNSAREILGAIGQLVTGQLAFDNLAGPVGIFQVTGEVAQSGVIQLVHFTAILSINLGLMNLLPLPALDGGKLFFFAIEAVRGKPIDPKKESIVHFIGFALLMLLMLAVTWNDVRNFFM